MSEFKRRPGGKMDMPNVKVPDMGNKGFVLLALLALVVWAGSGIYIVEPDEKGVVLRFGKFTDITEPGPHWHLPAPIEKVITPKVTEVKRVEIGFRVVDPGPPVRTRNIGQESLMLTGDENIIDINAVVQYRISDPYNYLFNMRSPEDSVREVSEAALREVVGSRNIDEALTTKKFEIQNAVMDLAENILKRYGSGVDIVQVQLLEVQPPKEVVSAFKDVASAKEDKNKMINEAQGYENAIIPEARGRVSEILNKAEGYSQEKVNHARGDMERFLAMYEEYKKGKDVTKIRLYLETMEDILPNMVKPIVDVKGNINPLLFLNQNRNNNNSASAPAATIGGGN